MKRILCALLLASFFNAPAHAVLAKYWRMHVLLSSDMETLTYNDGGVIAVRCSPWKIASGALYYGTTIADDMGHDAGETLAADASSEGDVQDNTSNLYLGVKGYFQVTADVATTGTVYLYLEESDDNTNWPSDADADEFDVAEDLRFICALSLSSDSTDEARGKNFEF